jgi:predicted outer membrane repeat protein
MSISRFEVSIGALASHSIGGYAPVVHRRVVVVGTMAWLACLVPIEAVAPQTANATSLIEVANGSDSGPDSYRAAIDLANSNGDAQPDVIEFAPSLTITLTSGSVSYSGVQPLTLNGHGSTIDGHDTNQILDASSASAVTLRDLTLRHAFSANGGGAVSGFDAIVAAERTTFSDNRADFEGGAISAATVRLTDCTFVNNHAVFGGALASFAEPSITRSTFSSNDASIGGVLIGGVTTIRDSIFSNNTAVIGAVAAGFAVDVAGSTFDHNAAEDGVGGVFETFDATSHIATSLFTGNTAAVGGGIAVSADTAVVTSSGLGISAAVNSSGVAFHVGAETSSLKTDAVHALQSGPGVNVTSSTFTGDHAVAGGSIAGGEKIEVVNGAVTQLEGDAAVTATNVTFTGEKAADSGGAIAVPGGTVALTYVTAADNGAADGAQVQASQLTSYGSLFGPPSSGSNCSIGASNSSGFNYSTDASCGLNGASDSQHGSDPNLNALGAFGGPTPTRPPMAGSSLVDAISASACDPTIRVDQRGFTRPQPGTLGALAACDIGAVEITAPLPTFTG